MAKVAWLGLGVMGYPMAGHLKVRGSHDVVVYNRSAAKADKWHERFGARTAPTLAEAARDCDAVFACVGNDDDLRSITVGPDGAFQTMRSGALSSITQRPRRGLRASLRPLPVSAASRFSTVLFRAVRPAPRPGR